jgi:hypothetical protein
MNKEFIKWLENQTYGLYPSPGVDWYWIDEEYDNEINWGWEEIIAIYEPRIF